jgi:anti-sigma factor RsiW
VEHLSQEQLDALVMGTASRDDEAVRRHLASCEACAHRLMRAAQLESDLYDAAAAAAGSVVIARARPAPAPKWRVALSVAAALAIVGFGAWSLVSRERLEVAPPPARPVRAPSADMPGLEVAPPPARAVRAPSADVPGPGAPRNLGPGTYELPSQDVCRCVTVELSPGPPTDPGASQLCTSL